MVELGLRTRHVTRSCDGSCLADGSYWCLSMLTAALANVVQALDSGGAAAGSLKFGFLPGAAPKRNHQRRVHAQKSGWKQPDRALLCGAGRHGNLRGQRLRSGW